MKRQWLASFTYALLGMLLFGAYEQGVPGAALFIYKNDFASSLIACQLAKKNAGRLANIEPASPLGRELRKTSLIDLMTCDSYQSIKMNLLVVGVSELRLKIVEADALNREPELLTQISEDLSSK